MVTKKFKATEGAPFSQKRAQIYGECLEKIAEKRKGKVKPEDVVREARNRRSPLHNYFNWDNNDAAEKFRLWQARNLINHITVVVKYDHKEREQKAFFSVNETPYGDERNLKNRIYITIERVLSEPNLREQVINKALDEVEYWEDKYKEYKELGEIFDAIKETRRKIRKKIKKKKK